MKNETMYFNDLLSIWLEKQNSFYPVPKASPPTVWFPCPLSFCRSYSPILIRNTRIIFCCHNLPAPRWIREPSRITTSAFYHKPDCAIWIFMQSGTRLPPAVSQMAWIPKRSAKFWDTPIWKSRLNTIFIPLWNSRKNRSTALLHFLRPSILLFQICHIIWRIKIFPRHIAQDLTAVLQFAILVNIFPQIFADFSQVSSLQ